MRRVAIAAGDPGYQAALALLVDGEPDLEHVGSASDVPSLVELIISTRRTSWPSTCDSRAAALSGCGPRSAR